MPCDFTLINCSKTSIDVAVIDVSINPIVTIYDVSAHYVILDPIDISSNIFHSIFYDLSGNFALNPNFKNIDDVFNFVGINTPYRTTCGGDPFCLLDVIYDFIEDDLNVCRSAFTPCTNIALTKQLMFLKTFYDLGVYTLECSLNWKQIIDAVNCEMNNNTDTTITADLIISIVFRTPTVGVQPIVVKVVYRVTFPIITDPYGHKTAV